MGRVKIDLESLQFESFLFELATNGVGAEMTVRFKSFEVMNLKP